MIRKVILIATVVVALWAAPAAAQYSPGGGVQGEGINQSDGGDVAGSGTDSSGSGSGSGDSTLARTGSTVTDLAPYGAALIVVGGLVVMAARRRSTPDLA